MQGRDRARARKWLGAPSSPTWALLKGWRPAAPDGLRLVPIYDVTVAISERMPVWPGDRSVRIEHLESIHRGDPANVSRLHLGSHTGTHVDAPRHFLPQGLTVDKLPLDLLVGPALVAEVEPGEELAISPRELARVPLPKDTARLLLKTRNSRLWENGQSEFQRDYVHLSPEAAEWLVEQGIRLVGVDYLSVEALAVEEHRVHHTLLGAGVVIIEGLDLSRVPLGPCELVCLPLKIDGGDGAPARVVIVR
jgi:arylformamidase